MTPADGCRRFGGTNRLHLQGPRALCYELDSRRFMCLPNVRTAMAPTVLHIQRLPEVLSGGIQRPGREATHSPPSNADLKTSCR